MYYSICWMQLYTSRFPARGHYLKNNYAVFIAINHTFSPVGRPKVNYNSQHRDSVSYTGFVSKCYRQRAPVDHKYRHVFTTNKKPARACLKPVSPYLLKVYR